MMDCPRSAKVLDIGAGSGIVAETLAEYYDDIVALEWDRDFAEFLKVRFEQDGQANVRVSEGSGLPLPFEDSAFDFVVMDGTVPRLEHAQPEGAGELLNDLVTECFRVLTPAGWFAMAVENRDYVRRILPGSDHRVPGSKPRSPRGYRRLVEAAGFTDFELYWAVPEHNDPMLVLPLVDHDLTRQHLMSSAFLPRTRWKRKVYAALLATGIVSPLMHSMYVVGRKP